MTDYEAIFGRAAASEADSLSPAGLARRAAMRDQLMGAVVSRRRRRAATRWGGSLAAAATLVVLAWPTAVDLPQPGPVDVAESEASVPSVDFSEVRDDADVLARYGVAATEPSATVYVDDAELLELLAGANRAAGIIRSGDRCVLTRDVTDPIGE